MGGTMQFFYGRGDYHEKLALALAALGVLAAPAIPAQAQRGDAHISGQGKVLKGRTSRVNVFAYVDGTSNGTANIVRQDFPNDTETQPLIESVTVTCANQIYANTFVFGGVIDRTSNTSLPTTRYFAVRDNGQGRNAAPDELSLLVPTTLGQDDPPFCLNLGAASFNLLPVENGNLMVRN